MVSGAAICCEERDLEGDCVCLSFFCFFVDELRELSSGASAPLFLLFWIAVLLFVASGEVAMSGYSSGNSLAACSSAFVLRFLFFFGVVPFDLLTLFSDSCKVTSWLIIVSKRTRSFRIERV